MWYGGIGGPNFGVRWGIPMGFKNLNDKGACYLSHIDTSRNWHYAKCMPATTYLAKTQQNLIPEDKISSLQNI
jgi:hypothetical protein